MISFEKVKTIFFDYDGTLHNSIKIYAPAFRKAYSYLVDEGYTEPKEWQDKEITRWLGFNPSIMWKTFMPNLDFAVADKCSRIVGDEMKELIELGKPELYEGALEVLSYLKEKGLKLVFISNCKIYYKVCHCKLFQLDNYFEELVCSEEYGSIPKYEILNQLKDRYENDMVIIGDRNLDIEAGKKNSIYTIGCNYGFSTPGELNTADVVINNILEIKNIFDF